MLRHRTANRRGHRSWRAVLGLRTEGGIAGDAYLKCLSEGASCGWPGDGGDSHRGSSSPGPSGAPGDFPNPLYTIGTNHSFILLLKVPFRVEVSVDLVFLVE